ncbi:uncharacterized protein VTP21DRAFT_7658 [Calcarisporiella thermophila]|uniref:uncharacterized protein n=1 Tax=Calcarisporiella thermophila TaxID=911321 RepID=UPI003744B14C
MKHSQIIAVIIGVFALCIGSAFAGVVQGYTNSRCQGKPAIDSPGPCKTRCWNIPAKPTIHSYKLPNNPGITFYKKANCKGGVFHEDDGFGGCVRDVNAVAASIAFAC